MDRGIRIALGVGLFLLATTLALQEIRSWDYFWHLKTGELIASQGAVPGSDPFSYTIAGKTWVNPHWLFQLGLQQVHALGGHGAVVLAKAAAVLLLASLMWMAGGRRDRPTLCAFALGLGLLAASDRFMARPEVLSFVFLAAELALLERFRRSGDAWVYAVVPLIGVWANVQGLFAVGLGVLALTLAGELAGWILPHVAPPERRRVLRLAAASLLATLACLLNPNGLDGVLFAVDIGRVLVGGGVEVGIRAVEMQSPLLAWRHVPEPVLGASLALLASTTAALGANRRRAPIADFLLLAVFVLLAARSLRNLALFSVVAAPILIRNAAAVLDRREVPTGLRRIPAAITLTALLAASWMATRPGWGFDLQRSFGVGLMTRSFPVGAAEWVRENRPPGRLFHHQADGSYLIWSLHPDYKVISDGRLELNGLGMREFMVNDPERFQALDRRFGFGPVLLGYAQFDFQELAGWLHAQRDWRLAFVDETAVVFVRRPLGDSAPDVDIRDPDLFPPLDPQAPRSTDDQLRRIGRARFYAAMGLRSQALREARGLSERYGMEPAQGPY